MGKAKEKLLCIIGLILYRTVLILIVITCLYKLAFFGKTSLNIQIETQWMDEIDSSVERDFPRP